MKLYLPRPLSLKVGAIFYGLSTARINLSNVNTTGLSATRISVLQQSVACDPLLLQVGFGRYEDDVTLSTVCTSSCATACKTRQAGQRCNAIIRDILGVNPSNQIPSSSVAAQYTSLVCNDCFISSLATVLAMPISSAGAYSTALAEVTSQCKTTIAIATPATSTTWSLPTTTSTPAGGEGSQYAIQAGDTCQSISLKNGISSAAMLQASGFQAYCANFPTSGTFCIPTSVHCTPYQLQEGNTCDKIASRQGLTKPQLVSWNPELASKGMTLCVSNPAEHQPTSTATPWTLVITNSGTAFSAFPSATPIPTLLPNEDYVTPFANGSWLDCDVYMSPPILLDMSNGTYGYTCADVAAAYSITVSNLLLWGPGINTTGGFSDPYELSFAYKYCVVPTATLPTDTTTSCVLPALAEPGWTCDMYAQRYNVTKTEYQLDHALFVAWNPSLNSDCLGIVRGYNYCVGTPSFHPGFPS
ncbi:hypothetical protein AAE478_008064 [Parahypoxylon ruwenzoriense]